MGKDAYFVTHDSNSRSDMKIITLLSAYGMEGYGMYWVLVEMLREQSDYILEKTKSFPSVLAIETMCDAAKVKKFLNDCINEFELFVEDETHIWSKSLLRRMEKLDSIKRARSKASLVRWGDKSKKPEKKKATAAPPFPEEEVKSKPKDEEKFLEIFNRIKKENRRNNFKPTISVSSTSLRNLKKILKKGYSWEDMEGVIRAVFKNKYALDHNLQNPTHLLVEDNFMRYVESVSSGNTPQKQKGPQTYG